ncbi:MAG: right-handed parallel beta-helix repeat-containing protein [Staphylococcus equorum]|nr:right-handed parallel beta-helix repeat-containing protein [Staphylococcus equorum]
MSDKRKDYEERDEGFLGYPLQNESGKRKFYDPWYNDKTDYNTNAPSYYDYLARMHKLIHLLADRIWEYDKELAKRFEEWDKRIEHMPEDLKRMLEEWMKDGTLDEIINENIFNDLNEKIDGVKKKTDHFIVNIEEFTGTDCQRIQKALNKVHTLYDGGTVYVPKHTYEIDEPIKIYGNTILYSEPGTVYKRIKSGYMLVNGNREDQYTKYNGNGKIQVINGIFDGQAHVPEITKSSNILFQHGGGIVFDNIQTINSNSHSMEINACQDVIIRNSEFLGQDESLTGMESLQLDYATPSSQSWAGKNDGTACRNVLIENNKFGKSGNLPGVSRAIGIHHAIDGEFMTDITIRNNRFLGIREYGIRANSLKYAYIYDNVFINCNGGIIFYGINEGLEDANGVVTGNTQSCSHVYINNNHLENINQRSVIHAHGRENANHYNINIIGNTIRNCKTPEYNLTMYYTNNGKINDNIIDNTQTVPIMLDHVKDINLNSNQISNADRTTAMMAKNSAVNVNMTNNIIKEVGNNGISCKNKLQGLNISNNIIIGTNITDQKFNAIYCSTGGEYININNNVLRNGYEAIMEYGVMVTNTIERGIITGNICGTCNQSEKFHGENLNVSNNF